MSDAYKNVDVRLHALKAVDVILAALQSTFASPNLIEGSNPFQFVPNDPKGSNVWICDPEGRDSKDRSSGRMLIMVYRGEFSPSELHLANYVEGGFGSPKRYSDAGQTNIMIQCEAGNKVQSETLASIVYQILKMYRLELMREFDISELKPVSVSAPTQMQGVAGEPWVTTVSVIVKTQEMYQITETANTLSNIQFIRKTYEDNTSQTQQIASLDSSM